MNIHAKYLNCCSVCKRFQPTLPKPAVGNLFDPDKMKLNQVGRIDLKKYKNKWIIYLIDVVTRYTRATFVENKFKETIVSKII